MNSFYLVAALALYSLMSFLIIRAMWEGVKRAAQSPKFKMRAFIGGFSILTIALAIWAFDTSAAMEKCMKKHSRATCNHSINR